LAERGSIKCFNYNYCMKKIRCFVADELHALAMGRKIVKNLHLAGLTNRASKSYVSEEVREPVYSPDELRGIVPADARKSYDIRSVIARIVDGSEFDEFKKLYGSVSTLPELTFE
jgi:3-methylcrotonyl-CoA carboxylase beta subunit